MANTQTSATDIADLQTQLRTFLLANGWTSGGANIVTNSDGYKFRLTANTAIVRDAYPFTDPDLPDHLFCVEFDQTVIGGVGYSSIGSLGGFPANCSNDFTGPMPNVWFYTDGTYAHVVAQVASRRYSHVSFGSLDHKGMHPAAIGYIAAQFYTWWPESGDPAGGSANSYKANNPANGLGHGYGHLLWEYQSYLAVPDGVADPTLDFPDGPIFNPTLSAAAQMFRFYDSVAIDNLSTRSLEYVASIENKAIQGGVPLAPIPVLFWGTDVTLWAGEIPGFAFCKINGLTPGQIISFAGDDWQVFPVKQQGIEAALRGGSNPTGDPNTAQYGYAYKVF